MTTKTKAPKIPKAPTSPDFSGGLPWDYYRLTLHVPGKLYGGIPKNPHIIEAWLESREMGDRVSKTADEMGDQLASQAKLIKMQQGFKKDNDLGLYIEARQVRAMLKDSALVLRPLLEVTNFKAKLAARVFVFPAMLPLGKADPDGSDERVIHVMTPMGPRDSLKEVDYMENVYIDATMKVLHDKVITHALLENVLEYAAEVGLGADRSQGGGRFTWTLTPVTP
mgnify:CR=1 FL=1